MAYKPWPQPSEILLPVSSTWITQSERNNLDAALRDNWIGANGVFNKESESALSKILGAPALTVSNGSVALTLALKSVGVEPGDEVIVPALTYAATASSVVNIGAKPVFADINPNNWGIDFDLVISRVNDRTKCIIVVFLYGTVFDISKLAEFAKSRNIALIVDCAEAFLTYEEGMNTAIEFADVCTYSFFANKLITTGEGGAVATLDQDIFSRMEILRGQGMDPESRYQFLEAGFNFRMSNLHAAILKAQLDRYDEIRNRREEVEVEYLREFEKQDIPIQMQNIMFGKKRAPWIFTTRLVGIDWNQKIELAHALARMGIETRPVFYPLPEMRAFGGYSSTGINESRLVAKEGISFPTGHHVASPQIRSIAHTVKRFFN